MKQYKLITAVLILFLALSELQAQVSNTVSNVKISQAIEGKPVKFSVSLYPVPGISEVVLAYKPYDESIFEYFDMELLGDSAIYTLSGDYVRTPLFSYYLSIEFETGVVETYPLGIPETAVPLEVTVRAPSVKDSEIIVLSPAPGEKVAINDMFISVSMIKASEDVDIGATKLYLGDVDITQYALFAGDLILFYAENFPDAVSLGDKSLKVEVFNKNGEPYHTVNSDFTVLTSTELAEAQKQFITNGSIEAESRNQSYNDQSTWFNNLSVNLKNTYDDLRLNAKVYVTSEEKADRQPRNRFRGEVQYQDWLSAEFGDTYPKLPTYILNGKRVRGVSGFINLGFFNIEATYGQVRRSIEGTIIEKYNRLNAPLASNVIAIDSARYGDPFAAVNFGTYDRQLFALRPSFGAGEIFQWGFTYLHGKDDPNSIDFGSRPRENVVLGTDMKLNLDERRIQLRTQASVSLINDDISSGDITDEQIDSLFSGDGSSSFGSDKDQFVTLKDIASTFITVNQYIGPLNPEELSSLAAEAELQLNYFNNRIRGSYIYRGNQYESFGQDFMVTDRKGINISDRIRMIDNQVFFTVSYESLEDNLQNTLLSTTKYDNLNTSVSYFPRIDFPAITLSYKNRTRQNDIAPTDTVNNIFMIDDVTSTILAKLSYDFIAGVKHNTNFSISNIGFEDESISDLDQTFVTASLNVSSFWNRDLNSTVGFTSYSSTAGDQDYSYFLLSLGASYRLLDDKLNLNLNINPSFGDFKRNGFDFTAQYALMQNLSAIFQLRYYSMPDLNTTNSVAGLRLRYTL
ncbi:MAG: hypothetical protein JW995_01185 [Melioribacteraceae bacterium]|nr:hypothetical protein [Melioribacteraceae bacterium]